MAEVGKPLKHHTVIPLLPGHKIDAPDPAPTREPAREPAPRPKEPTK